MARIRSVKPEFWDNQELARDLSPVGRMFYIAMWNFADEHARIIGDARWLKGRIFPFDDDVTVADVDAILHVLEKTGRAWRYEVNGAAYLFLTNMTHHQRLDASQESRLPCPTEADPGSTTQPLPIPRGGKRKGRAEGAPAVDADEVLPPGGITDQGDQSPDQLTPDDPRPTEPQPAESVSSQVSGHMDAVAEKSGENADSSVPAAEKSPPKQVASSRGQVAGSRGEATSISSATDAALAADVEALCEHLADRIEENGSRRPRVTQRWRSACRLLITNDKRTPEQVRKAIDWCQDDEFWRGNVLCMKTLRRQYDRLRHAAQRENTKATGTSGYQGPFRNPTNANAYEGAL